jgi:hypothetical protein
VAVGGADAVGAGVAAADDDDVLVVGADEVFVRDMQTPCTRLELARRKSMAKWMPL